MASQSRGSIFQFAGTWIFHPSIIYGFHWVPVPVETPFPEVNWLFPSIIVGTCEPPEEASTSERPITPPLGKRGTKANNMNTKEVIRGLCFTSLPASLQTSRRH